MPALQTVLPLPLFRLLRRSLLRRGISVNPLGLPLAISALSWRSCASSAAIVLSASACSRASCVRFGVFAPLMYGLPCVDERCDEASEAVIELVRRKNEKREDGVAGFVAVTVVAVTGELVADVDVSIEPARVGLGGSE